MQPLTVIIPTYNEEHNIVEAIRSVNWANEVLVIDSFSSDRTVQLAEANGAKVVQHTYDGPAAQKNRAIPMASHSWVLLLDADERVEPELKQEIEQVLSKQEIPQDAFWIRRRNFFMGKEIRFSGWQGDKVIRLIRRDKCRYNHVLVHEEIETGNLLIGSLKGKLTHYTYKDIHHYLEKWDRYTTWAAEQKAPKTPNPGFFHLAVKPAFRFFKNYFLDLGIFDGKVGFIICRLSAMSVFMRYIKIKQIKR